MANSCKFEEKAWSNEDFLSFDIDGASVNAEEESDAPNSDGYDSMAASPSADIDESTLSLDKNDAHQLSPPWIGRGSKKHDSTRIHALCSLHNEIVSFCHLMEPLPTEIDQREKLVERIRATVLKHFGDSTKVDVFGSQATGLFLPTSDIDIVVTTNEDDKKIVDSDDKPNNDDNVATVTPLQQFANAIQEDWLDELCYFEVIEKTRVPLVKFRHAPTNIQIDVCFNQSSGPLAAKLMKSFLEALPPLRPLTFVLKYFLAARALNEPYSGGVGSYMLQLLIVAFLQHRQRDAVNFQRPASFNLGSLLLEFFELYGSAFNYLTTGISVRSDGSFFPKGASDRREIFWQAQRPLLVALENPQDILLDVGSSSFRFQTIQKAFAVAHKILLCSIVPSIRKPSPVSILSTVLPPTGYMVSRMIIKRRNRSLQSPRSEKLPLKRKEKRQRTGEC